MTPREILIDQFKKVSTFIYVFILLFIVFIIFKLNYEWAGITVIIKVYQYIFAFYLIYNFSRIDVDGLKNVYIERYGRAGIYRLFFVARGVPFLLIYLSTIFFTFISYIDQSDWPWRPLLNLLDGRFSNIVVYSLILLIVLKLMRKPRITIPLFFVFSLVYIFIYELIYTFSPYGISVTGLKVFQIVVIFFAIIFEFFFNRRKFLKSLVTAIVVGTLMYSSGIGIFYGFYSCSGFASYRQAKASTVLLRAGFTFPLKKLERIVTEELQYDLLKELIYFSRKFNMDLQIDRKDWENLLNSGTIENAEIISDYVLYKKIPLSYESIISYAEQKSVDSGKELLRADAFIKYASLYFIENRDDLIQRFYAGNRILKLWIIRTAGGSGGLQAVPFLSDLLSSIDSVISDEAYVSLKSVTGLDPAGRHDGNVNDPAVIREFTEYYKRSDTGR